MIWKRPWKKRAVSLLAGGCILISTGTAVADIGTVQWQEILNVDDGAWDLTALAGVGFRSDGSLLAGGTGNGGFAVRYDAETGVILDPPPADPRWIHYDTGFDYFYGQIIDTNGDIYFAGRKDVYSAAVWKYNSTGVLQAGWPIIHPGTPDGINYGMAIDSSGFIYSVGRYDSDWHINKHNKSTGAIPTGFPLSYDQNSQSDTAMSVAIDSGSNFIVVGSVGVGATDTDWHVRKYSTDGTLIWQANYDLKSLNDVAMDVIVDSEDNIIVSGHLNNGIDNTPEGAEYDWYVVKYTKNGDGVGGATVLWEQSWDDGNSRSGGARQLLLDNKDNLYVGGYQNNSSGAARPFVQYRDGKTGILLKAQELSHPVTVNGATNDEDDYINDLALDGEQLVITGYVWEGYKLYGRTGFISMLDIQDIYNVTIGSADSDCSDGECNLQAALAVAALNNGINVELHLQAGTYTGNFTYDPATGNNGDLTILGGYSADFTSRTLDPTNTILDGDSLGGVLHLNSGIATQTTAVNGNLTVEGVTVRNGNASYGAGVFALTNSPGSIQLNNNIIENNLATENGGGCAVGVSDFVSPNGGNIRLSDNIIKNNRVWLDGATEGYGAGCSVLVTGTTVISNNLVYLNRVGDDVSYTSSAGGGFFFDLMAGELSLTNNTITQNQVDDSGNVRAGAGILLSTNANPWNSVTVGINNSIIYNNYGDDLYNRVISETGGVTEGSTFTISHSIYDPNNYSKSPDVGTVDPILVNNVTNNQPYLSPNAGTLYHLVSEVSPCIDSGDNNAENMPDTDLAGEIRPQDGDNDSTATANMGCYEAGFAFRVVTSTGANGSHPAPQIVDPGDTASFTFDATSPGYHITSISGCGIDYTNTDNSIFSREESTDAIVENCTINATYAINQYTLTASTDVHGSLNDVSTPSPQTVDYGATTMFTFDADTWYHIATIIGCGINYSNTDNSIVSHSEITSGATADCNVHATFAINQYTVQATVGNNGSLDEVNTPSPVTVNQNGTTSFTFTGDTNYFVYSMSGCGVSYQWSNSDNQHQSRTLTTGGITADCTVHATFMLHEYYFFAAAGENGALDASTPASQAVSHGSTAQYKFNADSSYYVASVSGCGINYLNTDNTVSTYTAETDPAIANCLDVTATFAPYYTVTASAGGNGSLQASTPSPQMVNNGSTTTFTFNADTGYHVATINGCGILYSNTDNAITSATEATGLITADCPVNATFAINTYTVSPSVDGGHGTIDPAVDQIVDHGDATQFDLHSAPGYHPDQVTGTCGGILTGDSFTSNAVTADCTVIASFTDQYTLSLVFAGNGLGTVTSTPVGIDDCTTDCSAGFLDGTSVTLSAVVADKKNVFVGWSGDVACPGVDDCIVTMDQAREITATFTSGFPWTMFLPAILNSKP